MPVFIGDYRGFPALHERYKALHKRYKQRKVVKFSTVFSELRKLNEERWMRNAEANRLMVPELRRVEERRSREVAAPKNLKDRAARLAVERPQDRIPQANI
jgi:hypothetical protein